MQTGISLYVRTLKKQLLIFCSPSNPYKKALLKPLTKGLSQLKHHLDLYTEYHKESKKQTQFIDDKLGKSAFPL